MGSPMGVFEGVGPCDGLGVAWSSDGLFEGLVGTWIVVAGSLSGSPTNANAPTDSATARTMPATARPMMVSVRFMGRTYLDA